ncbi:MAG: MFS transporter [Promethearchaeota archaeon]
MVDEKKLRSNIRKYFIASAISSAWLIMPIFILYLLEFNLTYFELGILEATIAIIVITTDVPSGAFADLIGRKWTTFLGCFFWSIGMFIVGFGNTFLIFLIGYIFFGLSESMFSGAAQALLFDTLIELKEENRLLEIKGKLNFTSAIVLIIGSISGSILYKIHIRLPFIMYGIILMISALIVVFMVEPTEIERKFTIKNQIKHMKEGFKISREKKVRFFIAFSILTLLPWAIFVNLIEQPFLISRGFTIFSLGLIFAITRGCVGLMATMISKIEYKLGEIISFYLVVIIFSGVLILLSFIEFQILIVIFLIILFFARDYKEAILLKYINENIESSHRATVFSIGNFYGKIFYAITFIIAGLLVSLYPFNIILLSLGILTFIIIIPFLIFSYINLKK